MRPIVNNELGVGLISNKLPTEINHDSRSWSHLNSGPVYFVQYNPDTSIIASVCIGFNNSWVRLDRL